MFDLIGDLMYYGIFSSLKLILWLVYCFMFNFIGKLIFYG